MANCVGKGPNLDSEPQSRANLVGLGSLVSVGLSVLMAESRALTWRPVSAVASPLMIAGTLAVVLAVSVGLGLTLVGGGAGMLVRSMGGAGGGGGAMGGGKKGGGKKGGGGPPGWRRVARAPA